MGLKGKTPPSVPLLAGSTLHTQLLECGHPSESLEGSVVLEPALLLDRLPWQAKAIVEAGAVAVVRAQQRTWRCKRCSWSTKRGGVSRVVEHLIQPMAAKLQIIRDHVEQRGRIFTEDQIRLVKRYRDEGHRTAPCQVPGSLADLPALARAGVKAASFWVKALRLELPADCGPQQTCSAAGEAPATAADTAAAQRAHVSVDCALPWPMQQLSNPVVGNLDKIMPENGKGEGKSAAGRVVAFAGVVARQDADAPYKFFIECENVSSVFGHDAWFLPAERPPNVAVGSLVVFGVAPGGHATWVCKLAPLAKSLWNVQEPAAAPAGSAGSAGGGSGKAAAGVRRLILKTTKGKAQQQGLG